MSKGREDNTVISFIIPAYNAEATIERAITSITSRMDNYEIIVVENGSTDRTTELVKRIAQYNKKVKIIHSEKGVSKARNLGIQKSKGEWIIFVDADDVFVAEESVVRNLTESFSSADFIICSYYKEKRKVINNFNNVNKSLKGNALSSTVKWMLSKPTERMTIWAKIYRNKAIKETGIYFDQDLRLSEDTEFLIRLLQTCKELVVSDVIIYRYCVDSSSTVRSTDKTRINGYIQAVDAISDKIDIYSKEGVDFILAHLNLICVHNIFAFDEKLTRRERGTQLENVLRNATISYAVKSVKFKDIRNINRIPALCFKYRLYMAGGAVCYIKSICNHMKTSQYRKEKKES